MDFLFFSIPKNKARNIRRVRPSMSITRIGITNSIVFHLHSPQSLSHSHIISRVLFSLSSLTWHRLIVHACIVCLCLRIRAPNLCVCECVSASDSKPIPPSPPYRNNRSHYFDAIPPAAFVYTAPCMAMAGMFDSMVVCIVTALSLRRFVWNFRNKRRRRKKR